MNDYPCCVAFHGDATRISCLNWKMRFFKKLQMLWNQASSISSFKVIKRDTYTTDEEWHVFDDTLLSYDFLVLFTNDISPRDFYKLVESLFNLAKMNAIDTVKFGYKEDDSHYSCNMKVYDVVRGFEIQMNNDTIENNKQDAFKGKEPFTYGSRSFTCDEKRAQEILALYPIKRRLTKRLALRNAYNGFLAHSVDCSEFNGLPLTNNLGAFESNIAEGLGITIYVSDLSHYEWYVYGKNMLNKISYADMPASVKRDMKIVDAWGAIEPGARYIHMTTYLGKDSENRYYFMAIDLFDNPMQTEKFRDVIHRLTGLEHECPQLNHVISNFVYESSRH